MACLQESMLTSWETRQWSRVGREFFDGFVAVIATSHSGGLWPLEMRPYIPRKMS